MSKTTNHPASTRSQTPICEYCGTTITDDDQDCPALDNGVCAP